MRGWGWIPATVYCHYVLLYTIATEEALIRSSWGSGILRSLWTRDWYVHTLLVTSCGSTCVANLQLCIFYFSADHIRRYSRFYVPHPLPCHHLCLRSQESCTATCGYNCTFLFQRPASPEQDIHKLVPRLKKSAAFVISSTKKRQKLGG